MSDNFNKPQNVSDLGISFEERLEQLGKAAKQNQSTSSSSYQTNHPKSKTDVATTTSDSSRLTNTRSQLALDEYKKQGKSKQILKVWFMLMQAFDSKMKHFFGEEPDVHFMKFAVSLTPESYLRLEANLLERLDEDREWPPSLVRLRQLANSPTKETMYRARRNLFHHPIPFQELDRVEKFIKRYKMNEVRKFSDRNFESEFNRKYTQWFREVLLENMDHKFEEQQLIASQHMNTHVQTENDRQIDNIIANGKAFEHKLGSRILATIRKKSEVADSTVSIEEIEEIEQKKLAEKIISKTGDH
ncbi:hypothetical protein HC752_20270 [Vibrio sp. S9_S30]|uniref:hypothetical protein n=1 Tax=Vibrio sp. S9_S30 TaxID=2720226 RepID=UPI0016808A1D|nr:hypothetical protein [Vibrio sp. S9_S30]MBD1559280.1 hypothetical protein [Vibrio sp. S9_S30]